MLHASRCCVDFRLPLDAGRSYFGFKNDSKNIYGGHKDFDTNDIIMLAYGLVRKMVAMVAIAGPTGTQFSGDA